MNVKIWPHVISFILINQNHKHLYSRAILRTLHMRSLFWLFFCWLFISSIVVFLCLSSSFCSPPAIERLSSGLFQEVIITNTIPVSERNYFPQLTILSVANLLGETIWRVHDDCSVSSILKQNWVNTLWVLHVSCNFCNNFIGRMAMNRTQAWESTDEFGYAVYIIYLSPELGWWADFYLLKMDAA